MFPLQGGIAGIGGLILFVIVLALYYFVARYIYRDAKSRGNSNATLWGIATFIALVVGFIPGLIVIVLYLLLRG